MVKSQLDTHLQAASAQYPSAGGCRSRDPRPGRRGWIAKVVAPRSARRHSASRGLAVGKNPWRRQSWREMGKDETVNDLT